MEVQVFSDAEDGRVGEGCFVNLEMDEFAVSM
jgi:hypothetical protein